jgi:hypothetical protein
MSEIDRRTVVKAAAWSLPVVALAAAAPAAAASGETPTNAFAATVSFDTSGAFVVSTLTIQSLSDVGYQGWLAITELPSLGGVSGFVVPSGDWRADFTTDTHSAEPATFISGNDGIRPPLEPMGVTQVQVVSSFSLSHLANPSSFRLWTHSDWTNAALWPGQADILTWTVPFSPPFS